MARIAGVNIPTQKRAVIALTYIHGIGFAKAKEICAKVGIPAERRVHQLTDAEIVRIREVIDQGYQVEGDLRREVAMNIKRLMDLGSYRGLRHRKGLPVRGGIARPGITLRPGTFSELGGRVGSALASAPAEHTAFYAPRTLALLLQLIQQSDQPLSPLPPPPTGGPYP